MKIQLNFSQGIAKSIAILLFSTLLSSTTVRAQTDIWEYLGQWYNYNDVTDSKQNERTLTLIENENVVQVPYTGRYAEFKLPDVVAHKFLAVTVRGGDGGSRVNTALIKPFKTNGGGGAILEGILSIGTGANEIPPGAYLRFVVGRAGQKRNSILAVGSEGGAGTGLFMRKANESKWHVLMVAGGGGGAYSDCCTTHSDGRTALTTHGSDSIRSFYQDGGGGLYQYINYTDDQGSCLTSGGVPVGSAGTGGGPFGCGGGGPKSSTGSGGGGYSGGDPGDPSCGGYGGSSYIHPNFVLQPVTSTGPKVFDPQNGHINFKFLMDAQIKLAADESKCLDDYGAGTNNGTNIQLYHCNDSPAQKWLINDNTVSLAKNIAKCMDLDNGNTANGANIRLWDCVRDNKNQYWIYDVANQSIRSGIDFNKCVDLTKSNTADGTNLQLWDCNNSGAQKWLIEGIPSSMPSSAEKNSIRLALNPGKCIDLSEGNTTNGANIQLWDCKDGNKNQIFSLDGRAIRMQSSPEKCIDLSAGNTANGANIQLWDCQNGNQNQQWIYDGFSKAFRSAVNINKCLDLSAGNTANGANIQLWDCGAGNPNQQFLIGQ